MTTGHDDKARAQAPREETQVFPTLLMPFGGDVNATLMAMQQMAAIEEVDYAESNKQPADDK